MSKRYQKAAYKLTAASNNFKTLAALLLALFSSHIFAESLVLQPQPTPEITPSPTATIPTPVLKPYKLKLEGEFNQVFSFDVSGSQTLTPIGENCWQMSLSSKGSVAKQNDANEFCLIDGELTPVKYQSSNKVAWDDFKVSGSYNAETHLWSLNKNGDDIEVGNDQTSYDNLSMQIIISEALNRGEKTITINNLDSHRLKTVEFDVRQTEYLSTQMGRVKTVKMIQRKGLKDGQRHYMWIMQHQGMWIPVRIKHYENNKLKYQIDTVAIQ